MLTVPGSETLRPSPHDVRGAQSFAMIRLVSAGVPAPRLEACLLLAHVLRRDRAWLIAHPEAILAPQDAALFLTLLERRCRREPLAYIVGEKDWLDLRLTVTPEVLIPRPETELLALEAIACLSLSAADPGGAPLAVDVGTGSGAIAIALARACPQARVAAVDISVAALRLAAQNARRQEAGSIEFLHGSLLEPMREAPTLVVANLPYIAQTDLPLLAPELAYEPRLALDGGADGLDLIRELVRQAAALLRPGAWLLLECGDGQATALGQMVRLAWPGASSRVVADYAGRDRVVIARVPYQAASPPLTAQA